MKKLYGLLILGIAALFLSGCTMKVYYGLDISNDGNVTVTVINAYDDEMIDGMISMKDGDMSGEAKTNTDEERWAYIDSSESEEDNENSFKDYQKEKYEQDGYKGYKYTLSFGKIDNLVASDGEAVSMDKMQSDSKLFTKEGDVYKLNIKASEDTNSESVEQYEQMGAVFDAKFVVTLPQQAKSNNATSVSEDGLTYTWDLLSAKTIELEFELPAVAEESKSMLIPILIGAGVLVVVIIVGCVIAKGKKKKTEAPVAPAEPVVQPEPVVMPEAPVAPVVQPEPVAAPQVAPAPVVEPPVQPVVMPEAPVAPAEPVVQPEPAAPQVAPTPVVEPPVQPEVQPEPVTPTDQSSNPQA